MQEQIDLVNAVLWGNSDVCKVTRLSENINATQKDIIDGIRNLQEVSQNIPITYDMLGLLMGHSIRTIQRNTKKLSDLKIVTIKKYHKKPASIGLNIKELDKFLKKNSVRLYNELIASAGMTYIDVFYEKSTNIQKNGLTRYTIEEQ